MRGGCPLQRGRILTSVGRAASGVAENSLTKVREWTLPRWNGCGGSTAPSPSGSARSTTPTCRAAGRSVSRGCCGRSARTGARCAPCARGSTSTPATSAGCCGCWRPTAWCGSRTTRPTGGCARALLTAAGRAERVELDRLSDELAASILGPLDDRQRARLTAAMGEVERLLLASMVDVSVTDPRHPDARHCVHAYVAELGQRFDRGLRPGPQHLRRRRGADPARRAAPRRPAARRPGRLRRAEAEHRRYRRDQAHVGVADRTRDGPRPAAPRRAGGPGQAAGLCGWRPTVPLSEAIALYRSAGYREVEAFNDEPYAHHWFEK